MTQRRRFEPIDPGRAETLDLKDFFEIHESKITARLKGDILKGTIHGRIRSRPPSVTNGDVAKDPRRGDLYKISWALARKGTHTEESEGLTSFDPGPDPMYFKQIAVEYEGVFYILKEVSFDRKTRTSGKVQLYTVIFWYGQKSWTDSQGRLLEPGMEMEFTEHDIMELAEHFDMGISHRRSEGESLRLCLDEKGGMWKMR